MDTMSGGLLAKLVYLCERHGLKDPVVTGEASHMVLWVTTGFLEDGTPVITAVADGENLWEIIAKVQALVWAWGRK